MMVEPYNCSAFVYGFVIPDARNIAPILALPLGDGHVPCLCPFD